MRADYLADDAELETVDRFFEAYLLWLFRFVLFCSSQGDAVARYLIPYARRITDAPLDAVPRSVGATLFLRARTGGCARGCRSVMRRSRSFSAVLCFFSSSATSGLRLVGQSCPSTRMSPCQRATTRAGVSPWARCGAFGRLFLTFHFQFVFPFRLVC
jgi:hypothetical protein